MALKPASIKVRALQWLAQREHSRIELRSKLLRLMPSDMEASQAAAEVDVLLDWLTAHGHLSQQRFVESRVNARQSRFGNQRIQRELQLHGAALDAPARQALKESELDRAREVWRRKYGPRVTNPAFGAETSTDTRTDTSTDKDAAMGATTRAAPDAAAASASDAASRLRQMRFLSGRGFSPEVIRRVVKGGGLMDEASSGDADD